MGSPYQRKDLSKSCDWASVSSWRAFHSGGFDLEKDPNFTLKTAFRDWLRICDMNTCVITAKTARLNAIDKKLDDCKYSLPGVMLFLRTNWVVWFGRICVRFIFEHTCAYERWALTPTIWYSKKSQTKNGAWKLYFSIYPWFTLRLGKILWKEINPCQQLSVRYDNS